MPLKYLSNQIQMKFFEVHNPSSNGLKLSTWKKIIEKNFLRVKYVKILCAYHRDEHFNKMNLISSRPFNFVCLKMSLF